MRIEHYKPDRRAIPMGDRIYTWFLATLLIFAAGFLIFGLIDTRRDVKELNASRQQLESKVSAALSSAGIER